MMLIDTGWLHRAGIIGMNCRNAEYIMRMNPRSLFPLVDDKEMTKQLADHHGIPTPPLYHVVRHHGDVRHFRAAIEERRSFAIKPARGSGGGGIVLVADRNEHNYVKQSGGSLSPEDMLYHISDILSGIYSLGALEDKALIEGLIHPDAVFGTVTYCGVPDVRVIVYRGVPAMAMVRLPTSLSDGKANLHQGAIGAGIDLGSGMLTFAVHRNETVARHPDTGNPLAGILVPHWDRILMIAARSFDMTGLGYLGADVVIDEERGPLLLELNARPGIQIQVANNDGLLRRLDIIDRAPKAIFATPESRVAWTRRTFN
ncbi:MAG TPA: alpha-L-glutamate ligase-like protein [Dissulfurispiraceae bacterium]|nr:alpha-L-glutamate ligase-like protein [Dissulfurispiraceae bacterium]